MVDIDGHQPAVGIGRGGHEGSFLGEVHQKPVLTAWSRRTCPKVNDRSNDPNVGGA